MDLSVRVEREFLPFVTKPARYLGNEYNTVHKKLSEVELRVALCYPASYEEGMSDPSFEILYYILNSLSPVWTERFFAPFPDAVDILKEKNIELFSLESKTALNIFDVVMFILRSESQYVDLLNMVNYGGIPSRSKNRTDQHSIVIGAGLFKWNPEPVADFFDVVLTGAWYVNLLPLIDLTTKAKKGEWNREQTLNYVSQLNGTYIPNHYKAEYNSFGEFSGLDRAAASTSVASPLQFESSDFQDNLSVDPLYPLIRTGGETGGQWEAASIIGCDTKGNSDDFIAAFERQIQNYIGEDSVALFVTTGFSVHIWKIVKQRIFFSNQELRFSFPLFEINDSELLKGDLLSELQRLGKDEPVWIYCGAGSPRLRSLTDQHYRDEDLCVLVSLLGKLGVSNVCLSFNVGLPMEKDEDITQLVGLIKRCAETNSSVRDSQLSFQISPFVPHPFTMLQWEGMETAHKLQGKYEILEKELEPVGIPCHLVDIRKSMLTAILARGSRSLADVIESAWLSGATGQFDESDFTAWDKALEESNLTFAKLLQPISTTVPLPWDHFEYGDSKYELKSRRLKALQGKMVDSAGDYVGLGSGMSREQFNNIISKGGVRRTAENKQARPENVIEPSETIQYGRKARRQIGVKAPIKKRVRIEYSKTGLARFISHLDVGRIFEIAARKASIPLVYTQGKSPHPRFSFGPPLPVGIASAAEYIDLDVEIGDESDIPSGLNLYFPEGITIVRHKMLFAKVPALSAVINIAEYHVDLSRLNTPQSVIENWMASTEIVIEHTVREEVQKLNIRPFVTQMQIEDNLLKIRTMTIDGKMIRINEVLDSLQIPGQIEPHLVHRVGQFIQNDVGIFTPFDII